MNFCHDANVVFKNTHTGEWLSERTWGKIIFGRTGSEINKHCYPGKQDAPQTDIYLP